MDRIIAEAEALLAQGFRELDIISQDVMSYGHDRRDDASLPTLLRALGNIGGHFWVRLLYGYPSLISDTLLETIAEIPQICHYLDVPIQHSHPEILQAMRRGATVAPVADMVKRVRNTMPDITLRTTCLVGFPGETEAHFQHLLDFCRTMRFDHLGAFVYSPEENTAAFELDNVPPLDVAEDRYARLMEQQKSIVDANNQARIGSTTDILLEIPINESEGLWRGRDAGQAPEVDGETYVSHVPATASRGDFITATFTGAYDYDMRAVPA